MGETPEVMNIEYNKRLEKIEEALIRVFPKNCTQDWIDLVAGESIQEIPPTFLDQISAPGWELLQRGGKRWRPLVLVLSHEMSGGHYEGIYDLSTLVELPHNGSLIVDDIEDGSLERRGAPAIHLIHGMDAAINAGNYIYFLPSYLLEAAELSIEIKNELYVAFLQVMRRLHWGQGLDILWHNDYQYFPKVDEYLRMCRYKTGALARLAAEIGFICSGASKETVFQYGHLWEVLGVAFQIMDDVKNLTTGLPGKLRGDDIVEGKKSLPVLFHAQQSADRGKSLMKIFQEIKNPEINENDKMDLIGRGIQMMQASDSIEKANEYALKMLRKCSEDLKNNYPENQAKNLLVDLTKSFA